MVVVVVMAVVAVASPMHSCTPPLVDSHPHPNPFCDSSHSFGCLIHSSALFTYVSLSIEVSRHCGLVLAAASRADEAWLVVGRGAPLPRISRMRMKRLAVVKWWCRWCWWSLLSCQLSSWHGGVLGDGGDGRCCLSCRHTACSGWCVRMVVVRCGGWCFA